MRVQSSSNFEHILFQGLIRELRILKDKVEQLEDQKLQYEKKLKATKVRKKVMNFLWPLQHSHSSAASCPFFFPERCPV